MDRELRPGLFFRGLFNVRADPFEESTHGWDNGK
jgi:hypothetical protein